MRRPPLVLRAMRQPELCVGLCAGDWDLLLRQAGAAHLLASLAAMLAERQLLAQVPERPRAHLGWAQALAERHAQAVQWEVREIARALAGLQLPLILLKGAAYAMAALPTARGRLFSDIDILVPKDSLDEVEAALMLHGWVAQHQDAYDQRYYREWMHELPPMQHARRQTFIDVHHAILPPTAAARPDPALLRAAARPLPGHAGLQTLAPLDLVLHSATHLFYDSELSHGLRDLVDIHRLLLQYGAEAGFYQRLAERAARLQLQRPLFYALRYSARLLHTPVPAYLSDAGAAAAPAAWRLALMDALFSRALLPRHASCDDACSGAARFLLYIRGNWLRMPPLLLTRHLLHKALLSPKAEPGADPA
ncbi:nucleotidyltransferase family protein [Rugamonas sp. CCM 8940]|uniref:nucleotidyltransferase domain-containing protein n=1 Tax=Rugamonas sp. CCM 8940 TaxID=2765359 RepID=UPI0018F782A4|nr:nucleotidyltransferase family protein [Rugamonas sp. CCM 8940]MBJ7312443.1 nucleotidyltransferase family protein [Rugamonas sp. CCM 8940]